MQTQVTEIVLSRQWLCCVPVLMLLLLCSPGQRVANEDPCRPAWPALSSPSGGDEVRFPDLWFLPWPRLYFVFLCLYHEFDSLSVLIWDILIAQILILFSILVERTSLLLSLSWGRSVLIFGEFNSQPKGTAFDIQCVCSISLSRMPEPLPSP